MAEEQQERCLASTAAVAVAMRQTPQRWDGIDILVGKPFPPGASQIFEPRLQVLLMSTFVHLNPVPVPDRSSCKSGGLLSSEEVSHVLVETLHREL